MSRLSLFHLACCCQAYAGDAQNARTRLLHLVPALSSCQAQLQDCAAWVRSYVLGYFRNEKEGYWSQGMQDFTDGQLRKRTRSLLLYRDGPSVAQVQLPINDSGVDYLRQRIEDQCRAYGVWAGDIEEDLEYINETVARRPSSDAEDEDEEDSMEDLEGTRCNVMAGLHSTTLWVDP